MIDSLVYDLRTLLWLLSSATLALGTYLVWPSRWNIPAHIAIGFFTVSQFVPIALLGELNDQSQTAVVALTKIQVVGSAFFLLGILFGSFFVSQGRVRERWEMLGVVGESASVGRRAGIALIVALAMVTIAIGAMGFVPMFAEDPIAAKYFRGSYGSAYAPVAPIYRAGTTIITLLIPISAAYAVYRRRLSWLAATGIALVLMVVTLQRGPAFTGLLLFLGVFLVARGRTGMFVILAIGSYVAGTLFYVVLGLLGVDNFEGTELAGGSVLATIAATAPDVSDAFWFFGRWVTAGEPLTLGRTFLGGLIPGAFPWNPGVWTLTLGTPSVDVSALNSGGLRLPLPLWGRLAFGDLGVILVPFISGFFAGFIARTSHYIMLLSMTPLSRAWVIVINSAASAVLVTYYTMSYTDIVQLVALLWIVGSFLKRRRRPRGSPRPNDRSFLSPIGQRRQRRL